MLFGETGVGKSSVINLIAREEVAKVSSDVNGCTMESTRYDIPFDGTNFAIFDTIGLEEPQMGINGYLKAIEKAYELIVKLGAAGGIHLLLFCMRGGRITATTQSNYRLFCECLCNTKVPIALVFTGLEREAELEDWWTRNQTHIEHYGIKSRGHACITAVQDEVPGEDAKYMQSREKIRELLKTCALKNEAFSPESHTWFAKFGKGMKSFIEKHRNPKRRDVMRVLTNRCKLDPETARKIADMMEKGDTEATDGNQDKQAGDKQGKGKPNPEVGGDENQDAAKPDAPRDQHSAVEAEPPNDTLEGENKSGPVKKIEAKPDAPRNHHSSVVAEPPNDTLEGENKSGPVKKIEVKPDALRYQHDFVVAEPPNDTPEGENKNGPVKKTEAKPSALRNQHDAVEVEPRADVPEGEDKSGLVKKIAAKHNGLRDQPGAVEAGPRDDALEREDKSRLVKKTVAKPGALRNERSGVEAEPRTDALEGEDKSGLVKKIAAKPKPDALQNQPGAVEAEPRTDALEAEDKSGHVKKTAAKPKPKFDALRNMPGAFEAEPRTDALEEMDQSEVASESVARDNAPATRYGVLGADPGDPALERKDKSEVANESVARDNALTIQYGGRPKMNDGDRSPDTGAVLQARAKRDGTKKTQKPRDVSTAPFPGSGQGTGSQS